MNGRGGLVWGGERVGMGEGVVRKQENKQDCIMGESTTAYELIYIYIVALLFSVHGKHLRSCRDGQLT